MKTELLSPAGSLRNMRYAFAYGADAVYAGQPRYSLRVRNNEFDLEALASGIEEAHADAKKFYVVSNIAPHNRKVRTFLKDISAVIEMAPDALIMSDPGLIMMVKDRWPDLPLHLSVQANAVNFATVEFWRRQGIKRVILSRELSLEEVAEIRSECPQVELEVFVHGALCIAYSGRCLLSAYINKRDPNQGSCTNACRWQYQAHEATQTIAGDVIPQQAVQQQQAAPVLGQGASSEQMYLLQESSRPDDYMPAFEDEHGTYIMNSRDLRAVQHVPRLVDMGVRSLKIEGRTKSHYYVARTAQVYRQAIDDASAGREFDRTLVDELENLANRGYTEGFYRRHVHDEYQNYQRGHSIPSQQQFVGEVVDSDGSMMTVEVKNRFARGDTLEVMSPGGNIKFQLRHMEDRNGASVTVAPGSGYWVRIPLPAPMDLGFALLLRDLPGAD